LVIVGLL